MPLTAFELYTAVTPRLQAAVTGINLGFGPEEQARSSSSPRIVWCKTKSPIAPTDRMGGNPRPIVRRMARIQAHLWGDNDTQTELLLAACIRAVDIEASGIWSPVEEDWPLSDKPRSGKAGAYCVLTFEARLYVEAAPKGRALITAVDVQLDPDAPPDPEPDEPPGGG